MRRDVAAALEHDLRAVPQHDVRGIATHATPADERGDLAAEGEQPRAVERLAPDREQVAETQPQAIEVHDARRIERARRGTAARRDDPPELMPCVRPDPDPR